MLPGALLTLIFLVLSALHWYWVFGGRRGLDQALPQVSDKPAFTPGPALTAFVALALLAAAVLSATQAELTGMPRGSLTRTGVWILAGLFAIRAIGDFKLVGIFKKVRGTGFAAMDSKVYTPLCLFVSALSAWLAMTS